MMKPDPLLGTFICCGCWPGAWGVSGKSGGRNHRTGLELVRLAGRGIDLPLALDADDARERPICDLGERTLERGDACVPFSFAIDCARDSLSGENEADHDPMISSSQPRAKLGCAYCSFDSILPSTKSSVARRYGPSIDGGWRPLIRAGGSAVGL